ncbi:MAG TPA: pyridoxamine 5'-phosphate oxidase family protein [Dehalococcoidia bacterium]|nr:pyridoxamine 5'-phosphate oxidase family protein [Dehalococcoidia bacterium]
MATWGQFAQAAPELAARGAERLGVGVAFIGTTAEDGSPRVHPFTPLIGGGRLLAFIARHTVKYRNLCRDPRYAMHAVLGEDDEEFVIIGRAAVSDDWATRMQAAIEARKINMTSHNDVAFEFMVERAHWAVWEGLGTPDIRRVAERWPERAG